MARRTETTPSPHACAIAGCALPGEHKAPRSREDVRDYQWLCLDHVREFNKSWNYFEGMSAAEIESFMHDAVTGHRPTWQREDHIRGRYESYKHLLQDELNRFMAWSRRPATPDGRPISPKERRALKALELEAPLPPKALKAHYRALVKRYHPDLHAGDPQLEERFKAITVAYAYLVELYKKS